ncbi:hypothetical protein D3C85_1866130 [compost metagenome]
MAFLENSHLIHDPMQLRLPFSHPLSMNLQLTLNLFTGPVNQSSVITFQRLQLKCCIAQVFLCR